MSAIFYGVGVGPGDPELITVKAIRVIKECDYVILPAKDKESCHAYRIAVEAVPELDEKQLIFLPFPMTMKKDELNAFHNDIAKKVEMLLDEEKNVCFLTIGDPTIYSTFTYVNAIVKSHGYKSMMINGITSFCACAARLGISLGEGADSIHIIPGSAKTDDSDMSGTRVYMKSGKQLASLKERLLNNDNLEISYVSNCGMENEKLGYSLDEIDEKQGYLTVLILKEKNEYPEGN